jgi:hypothetical protein
VIVKTAGYVLRIATEQWVKQVFNLAMYYSSIRRTLQPGQTIIFAHKTGLGDSFVGYGVVKAVYEIDELSAEEKRQCEKHDWKRAVEFDYIVQFEKPLLIKDTFLGDSKLRGRYFHGLQLSEEQVKSILSQAESI